MIALQLRLSQNQRHDILTYSGIIPIPRVSIRFNSLVCIFRFKNGKIIRWENHGH